MSDQPQIIHCDKHSAELTPTDAVLFFDTGEQSITTHAYIGENNEACLKITINEREIFCGQVHQLEAIMEFARAAKRLRRNPDLLAALVFLQQVD